MYKNRYASNNIKKGRVATLISEKMDLKTKLLLEIKRGILFYLFKIYFTFREHEWGKGTEGDGEGGKGERILSK